MAAYTAQQSESQPAPAVSAFTSEIPMEIDNVESAATGRGTKRPAFEEPNAGEHEAQKKPKLGKYEF